MLRSERSQRGIVDVHVHPQWGDRPEEKMEEMIRLADRVGIETICVLGGSLGFSYNPTEAQTTAINDLTIELVRRRSDRLVGFCRLNARNGVRFNLREIDRCFATGGFRGIKLAVAINARSNRLDHIMRKAEELEAVVLHHCWYKTVQKYPNESDPSDIAHLAARFPAVKIIMPHLTGCLHRGVQDVRPFENVYVDTSGSQGVAGMVEYGVRHLGAGRILFGSDMPGRDFSAQLAKVCGAKISARDKEMILRLNARRLLRLP